jgi:GNAT superfamily N-acetyltransferase
VVTTQRELWLAEEDGELVAILVLDGPAIDQLYVAAGREGRGVGAALVEHAKRLHPGGLGLWAFQSNAGALRFYERHGFRVIECTDGSGNMERSPDSRLAWP